VIAVVPLVDVHPIPRAPTAVEGLMNYRGRPLPVIDLRQQFLDQPSDRHMSTRILVVGLKRATPPTRPGAEAKPQVELMLGLIAEKATETERFHPSDFQDQHCHIPNAPQLGPVCVTEGGMIQMVQPGRLWTAEIQALFDRAVIE
jgi:chemotaxis-related protein WspB